MVEPLASDTLLYLENNSTRQAIWKFDIIQIVILYVYTFWLNVVMYNNFINFAFRIFFSTETSTCMYLNFPEMQYLCFLFHIIISVIGSKHFLTHNV